MTQMVRKLDRDARMPDGAADPIFSAIARHVAARAACVGLDDCADEEEFEAAHADRHEALSAIGNVKPTTFSGLLALARHLDTYLSEDHETERHSDGYSNGEAESDALRALIIACRHLGSGQPH